MCSLPTCSVRPVVRRVEPVAVGAVAVDLIVCPNCDFPACWNCGRQFTAFNIYRCGNCGRSQR